MDVQTKNGVVDIAVRDDQEAVAIAKKYLSYFQGTTSRWEAADQRLLRTLIPEQSRRAYDVRKVVRAVADVELLSGNAAQIRSRHGDRVSAHRRPAIRRDRE